MVRPWWEVRARVRFHFWIVFWPCSSLQVKNVINENIKHGANVLWCRFLLTFGPADCAMKKFARSIWPPQWKSCCVWSFYMTGSGQVGDPQWAANTPPPPAPLTLTSLTADFSSCVRSSFNLGPMMTDAEGRPVVYHRAEILVFMTNWLCF